MKLEGGLQFDTFKRLLLAMAQQRSVAHLLELVTDHLAATQDVALVRIWLLNPGAGCEICREAAHCTDRRRCLSLMSSQGCSIVDKTVWSHTDGAFRRIPLGLRKVGRIALTGQPLEVMEIGGEADWIADHAWVQREGIVSFAGQPLVHRGEVLGVLAIFTRVRMDPDTISMLRMVADHLASALVNAWSFEEIERLKKQIEMENAYLRKEVDTASSAGVLIGRQPRHAAHPAAASTWSPPPTPTCSSPASRGPARSSSPAPSTTRARGATGRSSRSTARAVPESCSRASSSATRRAPSPAPTATRAGLFEAAEGGTLFLDEVGEIPLALQVQAAARAPGGRVRRVGEDATGKVDVRIIAATNRNLEARDRRQGSFREDLYYRLKVFPWSSRRCGSGGRTSPRWPRTSSSRRRAGTSGGTSPSGRRGGAAAAATTGRATAASSRTSWSGPSSPLRVAGSTWSSRRWRRRAPGAPRARTGPHGSLTDAEVRSLERQNTLSALERCHWRIYGPDGASELLRVRPTTLVSRLKKMGIARRDGKRGGGRRRERPRRPLRPHRPPARRAAGARSPPRPPQPGPPPLPARQRPAVRRPHGGGRPGLPPARPRGLPADRLRGAPLSRRPARRGRRPARRR